MEAKRQQDRCHGWMMIRVRRSTHARFLELQTRRERARGKGQLPAAPHDTVTQDDVLRYLLGHEAATQVRRSRSRKRRRVSESSHSLASDSGAMLYTTAASNRDDAGGMLNKGTNYDHQIFHGEGILNLFCRDAALTSRLTVTEEGQVELDVNLGNEVFESVSATDSGRDLE